jgi:hypothetical protein
MEEKISDLDIELKLLANIPIPIENVGYIYSKTLKEIATLGINTYYSYLNNLCFDIDDLKLEENIDKNQIKTFDIIIANCIRDEEYKKLILMGLSLFFNENVEFEPQYNVFCLGVETKNIRVIHRDNFDIIKKILRLQHWLKDSDKESEYNPANAKARELIEKKKLLKQKINKSKNVNNDEITLCDLISIYCANGNGADILKVWDYTLYQFNDQFNRMRMLEDYNIGIQALIHGAEQKEELKTWMRKIGQED